MGSEPVHRVDRRLARTARMDLEVQVLAGRLARGTDIADVLASDDAVARRNVHALLVHVGVVRGESLAADRVLDGDCDDSTTIEERISATRIASATGSRFAYQSG